MFVSLLLVSFQIIFSVSKSHSSYSNCGIEQSLLYTNLHNMDGIADAVEMVQSKAILQNRGEIFPLAAVGGDDVVMVSRL